MNRLSSVPKPLSSVAVMSENETKVYSHGIKVHLDPAVKSLKALQSLKEATEILPLPKVKKALKNFSAEEILDSLDSSGIFDQDGRKKVEDEIEVFAISVSKLKDELELFAAHRARGNIPIKKIHPLVLFLMCEQIDQIFEKANVDIKPLEKEFGISHAQLKEALDALYDVQKSIQAMYFYWAITKGLSETTKEQSFNEGQKKIAQALQKLQELMSSFFATPFGYQLCLRFSSCNPSSKAETDGLVHGYTTFSFYALKTLQSNTLRQEKNFQSFFNLSEVKDLLNKDKNLNICLVKLQKIKNLYEENFNHFLFGLEVTDTFSERIIYFVEKYEEFLALALDFSMYNDFFERVTKEISAVLKIQKAEKQDELELEKAIAAMAPEKTREPIAKKSASPKKKKKKKNKPPSKPKTFAEVDVKVFHDLKASVVSTLPVKLSSPIPRPLKPSKPSVSWPPKNIKELQFIFFQEPREVTLPAQEYTCTFFSRLNRTALQDFLQSCVEDRTSFNSPRRCGEYHANKHAKGRPVEDYYGAAFYTRFYLWQGATRPSVALPGVRNGYLKEPFLVFSPETSKIITFAPGEKCTSKQAEEGFKKFLKFA